MYHLVAYTASIADVTLAELAAVSDGIMPIQNNHIQPQQDLDLLWAYVGGASLLRARINTPTVRQVTPTQIEPIGSALLPSDYPDIAVYLDLNMRLRALEEIIVEAYQSSGGAEQEVAILALADRLEPLPRGPYYVLRGTSTTAAVVRTWTGPLSVTWDTQLPQGRYACVGITVQSTNGIAARMTFDGQFFRPGMISRTSVRNHTDPTFLQHRYGVLGYFTTTNFPRIEVFCNVADNAHEIRLDLIKVG